MKKILFKKGEKGFTLIELLVVIAIIAILSAIVMTNFFTAKSRARDGKRISDLSQIQLALEQIFDKCNVYPADITNSSATVCTGTDTNGSPINLSLDYFISVVPKDPNGSNYEYFVTNSAPYIDYVLKANLENNNNVLQDDVEGTPAGINITGTCDDGPSGTPSTYKYCVQPK